MQWILDYLTKLKSTRLQAMIGELLFLYYKQNLTPNLIWASALVVIVYIIGNSYTKDVEITVDADTKNIKTS